MSTTTVNLGMLPNNRGSYTSETWPQNITIYKDNIVEFNNSAYIYNPASFDIDNPAASATNEPPYDAATPTVLNTGWYVFASGNNTFTTGEKVDNIGIDNEPTAGSDNLVKSGGVQNELALGAIYDVSAKNPTAGSNNDGKWESLSALLSDANLSTLIPTSVRKGGMSIKFIQSSDNKYVQYMYKMTDAATVNTFKNVNNWEKINLESEVSQLELKTIQYELVEKQENILDKSYVQKTDGRIYRPSVAAQFVIKYYSCEGIDMVRCILGGSNNYPNVAAIAFYSGTLSPNINWGSLFITDTCITLLDGINLYEAKVPQNAKYVAISNQGSVLDSPKCFLLEHGFATEEEFVPIAEKANNAKVVDLSSLLPTGGKTASGTSGGNLYSLETALTSIPVTYQVGGLTLRFVDEITLKYVTYRLLKDVWSNNTDDWESVSNILERKAGVPSLECIENLLNGDMDKIITIRVDVEQNVSTYYYAPVKLKPNVDYIFVVDKYETQGTVTSSYYNTAIKGFYGIDRINKIPFYCDGESQSSTNNFTTDSSSKRTRLIRLTKECSEVFFERTSTTNVASGSIYFKFIEISDEKGITQKTETVDNSNALICKQHIVETRPYYFDDTFAGANSYIDTSYLDRKILDVPEGKHFIFNTDSHIDYGSSTSIDPDGIGYGHLQKETEIMKYVKERLGIRNVIFGGDVIGGRNSKYEAAKILSLYCNDKFNAFGSDFIYCQGNHDANYPQWRNRPSGSTLIESDVIISDTEIYKRTVRNMTLYGKAVFDNVMLSAVENSDFTPYVDANTGLDSFGYTASELKEEFKAWAMLHYYYDDDVQKIRYIVLETGDYSHIYMTLIGSGTHLSMDLINDFVARTLLSVPENYDVVIVGHQFYYETDNSNNYNTSRSVNAWIHFYMLVDAYMHKTSTSYVCRAGTVSDYRYDLYPKLIFKSINSNRPYDDGSYRKYSFENRKGSGRVFTISGHYHANDSYMTSFDIIDSAIRISHTEYDGTTFPSDYLLNIMFDRCVANGCSTSWISEHPYATSYPNDATSGTAPMEQRLGTVKEVLFDVVTITPDNQIVCTRFGAGDDRIYALSTQS